MTTATAPAITRTVHEGKLYLTATARGTEYCLMRLGDAWFVGTRRLALGNAHKMGGGKHYTALADVAAGCKAFGSYEQLVAIAF